MLPAGGAKRSRAAGGRAPPLEQLPPAAAPASDDAAGWRLPAPLAERLVPLLEAAEDGLAGLRAAAVGQVLRSQPPPQRPRPNRYTAKLMVDRGVGEAVAAGVDLAPLEEQWPGVGRVYIQREEVASGEADEAMGVELTPKELEAQLRWEARVALVRNTFLAIAGLWAVTVASFLQVFVPQQCQPLPAGYVSPWFGAFPAEFYTAPHICSLYETLDWNNAPPLKRASLVLNATTAVLNVSSYFALANREKYIKMHYKANKALSRRHLPGLLRSYPYLERRLNTINVRAHHLAVFNLANVAFNFCFSGAILIQHYFEGPRTIIELVTSVMLIMPQLLNALSITSESRRDGTAMSLFEKEPVSLNELLPKHVEGKYYSAEVAAVPLDHPDTRRSVLDAARRQFKAGLWEEGGGGGGGGKRIPATALAAAYDDDLARSTTGAAEGL